MISAAGRWPARSDLVEARAVIGNARGGSSTRRRPSSFTAAVTVDPGDAEVRGNPARNGVVLRPRGDRRRPGARPVVDARSASGPRQMRLRTQIPFSSSSARSASRSRFASGARDIAPSGHDGSAKGAARPTGVTEVGDSTAAPLKAYLGAPRRPQLEDGHIGAAHANSEPDLRLVFSGDASANPPAAACEIELAWFRGGRHGSPTYEQFGRTDRPPTAG